MSVGSRNGRQACTAGLENAASILKRTHPEFVISKYRMRQADGISLVRKNREAGTQRLAFSSRPFVLCGLPVRRPPAGQLLYERRNGHFVLQLTGHPDFGLPFGQDRLVPIMLATMAVQQKSQVVRFRSASGNARHVWDGQGREGVPTSCISVRTDLRFDNVLWDGGAELESTRSSPLAV